MLRVRCYRDRLFPYVSYLHSHSKSGMLPSFPQKRNVEKTENQKPVQLNYDLIQQPYRCVLNIVVPRELCILIDF